MWLGMCAEGMEEEMGFCSELTRAFWLGGDSRGGTEDIHNQYLGTHFVRKLVDQWDSLHREEGGCCSLSIKPRARPKFL